MMDQEHILSAPVAAIGRPSHLADVLGRLRYWLYHSVSDLAAIVRTWVGAWLDLLNARPEAALLRFGRAVRHVQLARESMVTYRTIGRLIQRFPAALAAYRAPPAKPERLLFFIGYSRSGHSLVAALLDAHPDIVVSHELHALRHIERGVDFDDLAEAIQYNSLFFKQFGRGYSGYSYEIADQHQGRSSAPRIIGDKKANGTCRILRRDPAVIDRLRECLPVPFTFVHVVRNPFDNIASRARRTGTSLAWAARGYFANAELIKELKRRWPALVVDVYLDDLIADPKRALASLLCRLGIVDIEDRYLSDSAKLVFTDERRTGREVTWNPELKHSIKRRLGEFEFLERFAEGPEAVGTDATGIAS